MTVLVGVVFHAQHLPGYNASKYLYVKFIENKNIIRATELLSYDTLLTRGHFVIKSSRHMNFYTMTMIRHLCIFV